MCKKNEELLLMEEKARRLEKISKVIFILTLIYYTIIIIINMRIFNNSMFELFGLITTLFGLFKSMAISSRSTNIFMDIEAKKLQEKFKTKKVLKYIPPKCKKENFDFLTIRDYLTSENTKISAILQNDEIVLKVESNGHIEEYTVEDYRFFSEHFEIVE